MQTKLIKQSSTEAVIAKANSELRRMLKTDVIARVNSELRKRAVQLKLQRRHQVK